MKYPLLKSNINYYKGWLYNSVRSNKKNWERELFKMQPHMRRPVQKLVKRHFKKKRKHSICSCATKNSHESRNLKDAITFESMERSHYIFVLHVAQYLYNTMPVHHYTRKSTNSTITTGPVDRRLLTSHILHITSMAENIIFLHNIMFSALVALGEFSHRTQISNTNA